MRRRPRRATHNGQSDQRNGNRIRSRLAASVQGHSTQRRAYDRLDSYRGDGETFSAAVMRLTDDRSLLGLAGILIDDQADELETAIEDRRKRRTVELESFAKRTEN